MKYSGAAGKVGFVAALFPLLAGSGSLLAFLVGTAGSPPPPDLVLLLIVLKFLQIPA